MYELEYVKKRKKRKIVAIVGGVSTIVVTSLAIVSFLGRFVGTFTVSLEAKNVSLTLSEKSDFTTQSSFLRVPRLVSFQEFTYSDFEKYGDDAIDSDKTTYELGANYKQDSNELESLNYFKYTFFVKNTGTINARYDFSLNILENTLSTDGRSLDDTMRVMLYDNGVNDSHDKTVYAKRATNPHYNSSGELDYSSPITVDEGEVGYVGYAKPFESSKVVTTFSVNNFVIGEIRRYTVVAWLEGFRSSNLRSAPEGASIKLGVEINAYENE